MKIDRFLKVIVAALFLQIGFSCNEDVIDLEPIGSVESGFFNNEVEMDKAVRGIYQKIAFFYIFPGNQNHYIQQIFWLPSDDMMAKSSSDFAPDNFDGLNSSNISLMIFFKYSYQLIARANVVLEKIEEADETVYSKTPELKEYHKGEALFLRSYNNFLLWNVFGTAPVLTMRVNNINDSYPPNSTGTELLDQAIEDLEMAASLLPESWDAGNLGRVTKNSAYGLRAKCLVFRGTVNKDNTDFSTAITEINKINGASLTTNYGYNFEVAHENNEESLFEYQASDPTGVVNPFLNGYTRALPGNDGFSVKGDITTWWGPLCNKWNWIGNANVYATTGLQQAYESDGVETDPRKQFVVDNTVNNNNILKYVQTNAAYNDNPWATGGNGKNGGCSLNNPRILRYADVMLLKAEAIVRTGGSLSEAIGIINEIRERARNSTYIASMPPSPLPDAATVPANRPVSESNVNTVLEWIFTERRLELAIEEGHRWFDLRRRHIAGEIDLKNWDFGHIKVGSGFQEKHINFPFPTDEVTANPNMKQNDGY